jgi:hypothetical protein
VRADGSPCKWRLSESCYKSVVHNCDFTVDDRPSECSCEACEPCALMVSSKSGLSGTHRVQSGAPQRRPPPPPPPPPPGYMDSIRSGVITTIAIAVHNIPEVGGPRASATRSGSVGPQQPHRRPARAGRSLWVARTRADGVA